MKHTIVAAYGGNTDALFTGIRDLQTKKVILLGEKDDEDAISKVVNKLEGMQVPAHEILFDDLSFEAMFEAVGQLNEGEDNLLINVSTAGRIHSCIMLCAAYVNGLKAFGVVDNEVKFLPVMQFSYYSVIKGKKMRILDRLYDNNECCSSLEELSEMTDMSLPLISYHVKGNKDSEGLTDMGLVTTGKEEGRVTVELTELGRLMVKGRL